MICEQCAREARMLYHGLCVRCAGKKKHTDTFKPDPEIDKEEQRYHAQFNKVMAQIQAQPLDKRTRCQKLYAKIKKLSTQSAKFMRKHRQYFAEKRRYHWSRIEEILQSFM